MAVKCLKCAKTVRKNQHAIECDECHFWTHRTCDTGVSKSDYLRLVESGDDFPFTCYRCSNSSIQVEVGRFSITLESVDEIDTSNLHAECGGVEDVIEFTERSMELSINEDAFDSEDDTPVQFTVLKTGSQKGKPLLMESSGYTYVVKKSYRTNQGVHKFVKKLMALAFLPPSHIRPVFLSLKEKANTQALEKLCQYFQKQWIGSTTFPVASWSVFNKTIRTNNHVEGWNRRINSRNSERTLGLYKLVEALHKEARQVEIHSRLLHDGKLRKYTRTKATRNQEEVFATWRLYKDGKLSPNELLRICSELTGPTE